MRHCLEAGRRICYGLETTSGSHISDLKTV
jgi:hypothetical protein